MVDGILQQFFNELYISKYHYGLGDYGIRTHSAKKVIHHRTFIWLECERIADISLGESSMKKMEEAAEVLQGQRLSHPQNTTGCIPTHSGIFRTVCVPVSNIIQRKDKCMNGQGFRNI
jgi:hypothetical protein